jgi:hypothetical protein
MRKISRWTLAALWAGSCAVLALAPGLAPAPWDFPLIALGQPNDLAHFRRLLDRFGQIEADLLLDESGELVAAHGKQELEALARRPAHERVTLTRLLQMPYARIYLDMKDTLPLDMAHSTGHVSGTYSEPRAIAAVERTAAAIAAAGRNGEVYVMIYRLLPEMVTALRAHGVQGMIQGYGAPAEALDQMRQAAGAGVALACYPLRSTTPELIAQAHGLGVRQVPYTFFQEPFERRDYDRIFRAGLQGLILRANDLPKFRALKDPHRELRARLRAAAVCVALAGALLLGLTWRGSPGWRGSSRRPARSG